MEYVALIQGQGDGCDYTLDCNKSFHKFTAINFEDAKKYILKIKLKERC